MLLLTEFIETLPEGCLDCGKPLDDPSHGEDDGQHIPTFYCKNIECFCGLCEQAYYEIEERSFEDPEDGEDVW